MVEHKLISLVTMVRLLYMPGKNYTTFAAMLPWRSYFVKKNLRPGHKGWKNFHPHYRYLGGNVRDFGNRGSLASHLKKSNFFPKKRAARRDLGGNRASRPVTPSLNCESESGKSREDAIKALLE